LHTFSISNKKGLRCEDIFVYNEATVGSKDLALISIVVPIFNESSGLFVFHKNLKKVMDSLSGYRYEIIYCDDGSSDSSVSVITQLSDNDSHIRLVTLSRNFGKEYALTAGINESAGECIITLDGDGQHPVDLIPSFIKDWEQGSQVVIGVRSKSGSDQQMKRLGSKMFYKLFNRLTGGQIVANSTDFRLIDKEVQTAFLQLGEASRITRGLIDWLGFERSYLTFEPNIRKFGNASYSFKQLIRLAIDSTISLTLAPLYTFGYLGIAITLIAGVLGIAVFIEQIILGDPLLWKFTGTAMLGILILFLVGIILISQGILSLYVSHIHLQSKDRPLYIINRKRSIEKPKK
jgi:glycosyltransferase involved in cell wall biosynthesis